MLAPINMISFLLSLLVVDHQERRWRLSQHASGSDRFRTYFSWGAWLDPEPYQDAHDHKSAPVAGDTSFNGWYRRKKHRAMAKLEFNDAFDMRGRVLVALLAWCLLVGCAIVYAVRRMYTWIF